MPNDEFGFSILSQAHNSQGSTRDQKLPNNNSAIKHSNSVIAEAIVQIFKQSTCVIKYNGNSDFNIHDNTEFIDVNLSCNKLSIWLLANDSIACIKKRRILETKDKANKTFKVKTTWKKKIPIKRISKKSSKV